MAKNAQRLFRAHYLWWVSDDGQSNMPMGALEYDYPESETQEEAELQAWAELQVTGHDMTGRMVWDVEVDEAGDFSAF